MAAFAVDLESLHPGQRLVVEELIRRGATVSPIDYDLRLFEVGYKGRHEYLLDRTSKVTSYVSASLAGDKHIAKKILQNRAVPVPEGHVFNRARSGEALRYADSIGYPVVFKPNSGTQGAMVRSGIESAEQLEKAICDFYSQGDERKHFIVERHILGHEYRIFITVKGDYAVLLREPAYVTGNGQSSIRVLAECESEKRRLLKEKRLSALCDIVLDQVSLSFLKRKQMDFDYVPGDGEKVYLRLSSNLSMGGVPKDVTGDVHSSVIDIARAALSAFDGLPCAGVDFITTDIGSDQSLLQHGVIEVNSNPALLMHHLPAVGQPRYVASYLVDVMFPHIPKAAQ